MRTQVSALMRRIHSFRPDAAVFRFPRYEPLSSILDHFCHSG